MKFMGHTRYAISDSEFHHTHLLTMNGSIVSDHRSSIAAGWQGMEPARNDGCSLRPRARTTSTLTIRTVLQPDPRIMYAVRYTAHTRCPIQQPRSRIVPPSMKFQALCDHVHDVMYNEPLKSSENRNDRYFYVGRVYQR